MKTTRAVTADQLGPPDVYKLIDHDPGPPGPGEVRIRVRAAAISYVDVLLAAGKYQLQPPTPFCPGSECSGVVEAIGEGVVRVRPGDHVMMTRMGGIFCEAAVCEENEVEVSPDGLTFEEASAFKVSYSTAYHALADRGGLQAGESLLVLGAAGAVGYAAIQIGKALGARVIASASTPEKRAVCLEGGADAVVEARADDWRDQVKAANGGKPVDVVLDPIGGEATELAFRSLAWKGRLLVIGFAGGGIARLPTNLPLLKGASLVGVDIRQFSIFEPEKAAQNVRALFAMQAEHDLKPYIGARYPIEDYRAAMKAAYAGEGVGRIILTMDG